MKSSSKYLTNFGKKNGSLNMEEANVVTLYKKGNVEDPANYRPIALLQSIYKIYAGMIKNRLADAIDDRIWKLQFGFRGKKSTAQAMFICRRLQDIIEKSDDSLTTIFLDWEKRLIKCTRTNS